MEDPEIISQLRDWILDRAGAASDRLTDSEMPILEEGLLSSLDIVEFILFIESLRGEEVDIENIEPEVFTNLRTLHEAFFADKTEVAATSNG
ncbi:MAG: acyl carrier protein [Myxococcota bacterium]|jgi:acyl carrier protein